MCGLRFRLLSKWRWECLCQVLRFDPFMPTLQLLNSLHKVRTEIRAKRKEYVLALQIADIELQILLDLR